MNSAINNIVMIKDMYSATRQRVNEIIGEASMCWSETPKGVFDSGKAIELSKEIMSFIGHACSSEDMHPYECNGEGKCMHCDKVVNENHNPETCELCQ